MHNLIDLARYPLDRLDSSDGKKLVAECIAALERKGMFTLKGFVIGHRKMTHSGQNY